MNMVKKVNKKIIERISNLLFIHPLIKGYFKV